MYLCVRVCVWDIKSNGFYRILSNDDPLNKVILIKVYMRSHSF